MNVEFYSPPKLPPMRLWERWLYRLSHRSSVPWLWIIRVLQRTPLVRRLFNRIYLIAPFTSISLPTVRAAFPMDTIRDIIDVAPMMPPADRTCYYLRYKNENRV